MDLKTIGGLVALICGYVCMAGSAQVPATGQNTQQESSAQRVEPPKVREARELGRPYHLPNTSRLLVLLTDSDERVRATAAEALGWVLSHYATPPNISMGGEDPHPLEYLRYKFTAPFEVFGYRPAVLHALSDPSPLVRAAAAKAVGNIFGSTGGDKAKAADDVTLGILPLLKDPNDDVASAAADAVSQIGIREAIPGLMGLLQRPGRDVRLKALYALNFSHIIRQKDFVDFVSLQKDSAPFIHLLKDPDPELRKQGSFSLASMCSAQLCDASTVPFLLDALQDAQTRFEAVRGLLHLKDANTVEPVLAVLKEDASQNADILVQVISYRLPLFIDFVGHDRAIDLMLEYLKNGAPAARAIVASTLPRIKDERLIPSLIEASHDPEAMVRRSAVDALGGSSDPRIIPSLIESLQDSDDEVVLKASNILEFSGDPRALKPLIGLLHRNNPDIQSRVISNLPRFKDSTVIDALTAIVEDGGSEFRGRAATALCVVGDPRGANAVRNYYSELLKDRPAYSTDGYRACLQKLQAASHN
jgi:HEAT repeat protein